MNRESLVVMRFYRLANISRDLFELILNDGPINMQVFEARGKFFKAVIEDPMIVDFFGRAGENGEKMSKQLQEIYNDTYEQKKFLNVKDDGQYADKSSRVRVLDLAVGTYHSLLDLVKKFVEDAHKMGLKVNPWTVDDTFTIDRLLKIGCDGIITDLPDVVGGMRERYCND